jgi:hypothetical protein
MFKTWTGADQAQKPLAAPQGGGSSVGPGGWHPTILYLIALVLAEIIVVGILSRNLLK